MHLDSEQDNNEANNLKWGNAETNRIFEDIPLNKQRKQFWKERANGIDFERLKDGLPGINDFEGDKESKSADIRIKQRRYRWKWRERGVLRTVKDAMPEKRGMPFTDASLEFESTDLQVPHWDCRLVDEVNGPMDQDEAAEVENSVQIHDRTFPRRFFLPRHWIPFHKRFTDDQYIRLISSSVNW